MWTTYQQGLHFGSLTRSTCGAKPRRQTTEELEFGELGRDPRLPEGWYILPVLALGVAIIGATLALL